MIRALIFDLDGVVADTVPAHRASWARLAAEEGIAFDDTVNTRLLGRTREDSLALFAAGRVLSAAEQADWLARKQAYFLDELRRMGPGDALPGVRALIEEARGAGLRIALASSSRNARGVLGRLELAPLFDSVADGATVARPKPAPHVFLWTAWALREAPGRCLVLEDSAAGCEAALAGGFPLCALGVDEPRATFRRASLAGATLADFGIGGERLAA